MTESKQNTLLPKNVDEMGAESSAAAVAAAASHPVNLNVPQLLYPDVVMKASPDISSYINNEVTIPCSHVESLFVVVVVVLEN